MYFLRILLATGTNVCVCVFFFLCVLLRSINKPWVGRIWYIAKNSWKQCRIVFSHKTCMTIRCCLLTSTVHPCVNIAPAKTKLSKSLQSIYRGTTTTSGASGMAYHNDWFEYGSEAQNNEKMFPTKSEYLYSIASEELKIKQTTSMHCYRVHPYHVCESDLLRAQDGCRHTREAYAAA